MLPRRPIAVLMAVYAKDDPELFLRAMRSVFDQQLPDRFEIRVFLGIDGPLPARLATAVESVRPRLAGCTTSQVNLGLAATLNRLLDALTNEELIFRMDADDYSMPGRFLKQIQFMELHPEVDILGTAMLEIDSSGRSRIVRYADDSENLKKYIAWRTPVAHPTVCLRRCVFDAVGHYPLVPMNEDIALWFRCLERGLRFANLKEPLYQFRVDERFFERRGREKALAEFRTFREGLRSLQAPPWRLLPPAIRLLFRFMPTWAQRVAYSLRSNRR